MLYRDPALGYNGPMLSAKSLPDITQELNRLAEIVLIAVRLSATLGTFLLALTAVRPVAAAVAAASFLALGSLAVTAVVRDRGGSSLAPLRYPGMALDVVVLLAIGLVALADRSLDTAAIVTLLVLEAYSACVIVVAALRLSLTASLLGATVGFVAPLVLGTVAALRFTGSAPSLLFAAAATNALVGSLTSLLCGRYRALLQDNMVTEDTFRASRRLRMTMDIVSASIFYLHQLIDRLGDISATLAAGARTQLARVEQATSSEESIRVAIQRIVLAAQVSNQTISRASRSSESGKSIASKATAQIVGTRELVSRMVAALSRVTETASQTSLLTLNASIEASRSAEEQGGFTMIAEEIRQLAEKSVQFAGEAGKWARQIEETIEQGGESFLEAAKVFDGIARDLTGLGSNIKDLSTSVKDQQGSGQVASSAIEGISAVVEDNRLSAEAVTRIIGDLKKQILRLEALVQDKTLEAEALYRTAQAAD